MSTPVLADPLPRVIAHLGGHPDLSAVLGGAGRVGARNVAPYPRLRVIDPPGGDDRDLRWLSMSLIQLEAYGDLDGAPGKAALRRALYLALAVLAELPALPAPPGEVVITAVRSAGGGGWSPLPSGQGRYLASVHVWAHPPRT